MTHEELVEAVARAIDEKALHTQSQNKTRADYYNELARAALGAVAKAAGMDSVALGFVAWNLEAFGHCYDVEAAALLRALAGAADG